MSGTSLKWWRIIVILVTCFLCRRCYANVGQHLIADGTDERMSNVVHAAANVSLLSCGVKCTRSTACLTISYHRQSRSCELSSSSGSSEFRISSAGWTVYRQMYDCPNSVSGFINVGTIRIKLCPVAATWQQANSACSQLGRLVKIDTVAKMDAIRNYLWTYNYPGDVWINGNRWSGIWSFDDGTPMPPTSNIDFWDQDYCCDVEQCVRLRQPSGFKMNDQGCNDWHGYICEML